MMVKKYIFLGTVFGLMPKYLQCFRYKVDDYSTLTGEVNTPSYAFHNMEFVMNIKKTKVGKQNK
jgi:hypothetical protein